jgi:ferredoxin
MRSGVVFCTNALDLGPAQVMRDLQTRLKNRNTPTFLLDEKSAVTQPDQIREFIGSNNLEGLVVFCSWKGNVIEGLRFSAEKAGLTRQAVNFCEIEFLLGEDGHDRSDEADTIVLVSLARIEHADHIKDAVLKTVLGGSKVSRRDLFRSIPRVLKVQSDIPAILKDSCGPRFASCHYCIDACAFKAITWNGDGLVIDDRLCTECGACARDCPIGAIQCPSMSDVQISAMLTEFSEAKWNDDARPLVLTCELGMRKFSAEMAINKTLKAPIVPVVVPCVGSIASHHYLWAESQGIRLVTVCPDESCINFMGVTPMQNHVESYRKMLGKRVKAGDSGLQHLVLREKGSIVDALSALAQVGVQHERTSRLFGTERRDITLNVIRELLTDGNGVDSLPRTSMIPFFDLAIDTDKCSFCDNCERDCPDQAIKFVKDENSSRLVFDPCLCGGCRICEAGCPEKAIAISRLIELAGIVHGNALEKACDEVAKCARCGTSLGWKRGLARLERRFSQTGYSEQMLRTLRLCQQCKIKSLIEISS